MTDLYTLTVPHGLDMQGLLRAVSETIAERDRLRADLAGYVEANRYMKGELDDALEDARKYAEARRENMRLRDMLYAIVNRCEGQAKDIARAALEHAK